MINAPRVESFEDERRSEIEDIDACVPSYRGTELLAVGEEAVGPFAWHALPDTALSVHVGYDT